MFLEKYFLSWRWSSFSFYFFLSFYRVFGVIYYRPIMLRVSVRRVCLIRRSIGEDELRDGHTLTSISHGLSLLSIRISKPYSSKPQFLLSWVLEWMSSMTGSAEMQVFIITSFILLKSCFVSMPFYS